MSKQNTGRYYSTNKKKICFSFQIKTNDKRTKNETKDPSNLIGSSYLTKCSIITSKNSIVLKKQELYYISKKEELSAC